MTESEIRAYIASEVAAQLQAITSKDIASESDVPTLSDAEWDTNNSITSLPVVYNGSAWRKIGAGFLRTLRNAAAVVSTAWNALKNNGTSVSWIPTVDTSGNAGKTSPADLAAVLGVGTATKLRHVYRSHQKCINISPVVNDGVQIVLVNTYDGGYAFSIVCVLGQLVRNPNYLILGDKENGLYPPTIEVVDNGFKITRRNSSNIDCWIYPLIGNTSITFSDQ